MNINKMREKVIILKEMINQVSNIVGGLLVAFNDMEKLEKEINDKKNQIIVYQKKLTKIRTEIEKLKISYPLEPDDSNSWNVKLWTVNVTKTHKRIVIKQGDVCTLYIMKERFIDYDNEFMGKEGKNE